MSNMTIMPQMQFDNVKVVVKHQHGHRRKIDWFDYSLTTRKHHSFHVPARRWNRYMTEDESYEVGAHVIRAIYRFKTQERWSVEKMHKIRTQKKRAVGRRSKGLMQESWGGP